MTNYLDILGQSLEVSASSFDFILHRFFFAVNLRLMRHPSSEVMISIQQHPWCCIKSLVFLSWFWRGTIHQSWLTLLVAKCQWQSFCYCMEAICATKQNKLPVDIQCEWKVYFCRRSSMWDDVILVVPCCRHLWFSLRSFPDIVLISSLTVSIVKLSLEIKLD